MKSNSHYAHTHLCVLGIKYQKKFSYIHVLRVYPRVTTTKTKNAMHVIKYPVVGTQVQFIGCRRDSIETTCVLGDATCGRSDAPASGAQGNSAENDAGEKDAGEKDGAEKDAGEKGAGKKDAGEKDAGEKPSPLAEVGVSNSTTKSGGRVHSISSMLVGLIVVFIAKAL